MAIMKLDIPVSKVPQNIERKNFLKASDTLRTNFGLDEVDINSIQHKYVTGSYPTAYEDALETCVGDGTKK